MDQMSAFAVFCAGVVGAFAGRAGRSLLSSRLVGVRPPRWCCEAGVGLLWALVAARTATGALPVWWAPVPLLLGWAGVLLAVCDLVASRLPDVLTLPAYPFTLAAVGCAAVVVGEPAPLVSALLGAVLFASCYALVRMLSPPALGPGDVKLSGSLGAAVGAVSVPAVLGCVLTSAVLTVLHACCTRKRAVAHGPAMLLPAWLVTSFGPIPGGG
ncbi:A24 family peptidase [Saccharopolyspora gloriosae]|uniref:prepilin peptidase n=1 Tax=Saccharopolyspora gloriosae TaxID=455344 RepID=UPI001FB7D19E|nr:A24 family peptidase [Saccharopolyspora gloriosae]